MSSTLPTSPVEQLAKSVRNAIDILNAQNIWYSFALDGDSFWTTDIRQLLHSLIVTPPSRRLSPSTLRSSLVRKILTTTSRLSKDILGEDGLPDKDL